jgi:hypothetical protein
VTVAWSGGLVVIVGLALAGSLTTPPPIAIADPVPSPIATGPASPPTRTAADPAAPEPVLRIIAPSREGALITTPDLVVRGSRSGPAGPTQVTLLAGSTTIARETLPASGAGGAFRFDIAVPGPRPGGSMVLEVIAYSTAVRPYRVVRIPVEIGAILAGAPRNVGRTGEGPIGEDGIVGGIVFGNAWDPEALGTPSP